MLVCVDGVIVKVGIGRHEQASELGCS